MDTDQSKQCNITNSTGKDVVIALAVSHEETTSSNPIIAANGQLEILNTSGGSTIIKNDSSAVVTLDWNFKQGSHGDGYVQDYDLIICDSTWMYPLAVLPIKQQASNDSTGYAAQTIASDNLTAMNQAINFYQTITVYPNSGLAQDYFKAIEAAKAAAIAEADGSESGAAIADAVEKTMTSFFKGTQEYQRVTLADVVAVDNYYNNFPAIWTKYQDSMTYYLYGSDGTTAFFAGTLTLQQTSTFDITKTNGGYNCLFVPAVNPFDTSKTDVDKSKAISLTYINGLFVDDPNNENPGIAIKGSFVLKRLFTLVPEDKTIMIIVTGTVNNLTCIGFDTPQISSDTDKPQLMATKAAMSPAAKYWDTLIHPANQKELIISIMTFICAGLLIPTVAFAIYRIYKAVKYTPTKPVKFTRADIEDIVDKVAKQIEREQPKWFGSNRNAIPPHEFASIQLSEDFAYNYLYAKGLYGAFTFQEDSLEQLLKYESILGPDAFNSIQSTLDYIDDYVRNLGLHANDREFIEKMLSEGYQNFQGFQKDISGMYKLVQSDMLKDESDTMDENIKMSKICFDNLYNTKDDEEAEREDVSPEAEEIIRQFE